MLEIEARFSTVAMATGSGLGAATGLAATKVVVARKKREARRRTNITKWVGCKARDEMVGGGGVRRFTVQ